MNPPPATAPAILTVGLNPVWQRILELPSLEIGGVNRATDCLECFAGKGANVLRALQCAGRTDALLAQFAGGANGARITEALDAKGIAHFTVQAGGNSRICTTLLDRSGTPSVTEIIDPSPTVAAEAQEELVAAVREDPRFDCSVTALCGTWPPGVDASVYVAAAARGRQKGIVLLDAWRDVGPVLEQGVDILKINEEELRELSGERSCEDAARLCLARYPIRCLAVTAGARPARLFTKQSLYSYHIPPLEACVNPIGAGDCVTAGMLASLVPSASGFAANSAKAPPLRPSIAEIAAAFRQGLAWGRASCKQRIPAAFNPAEGDPAVISMQRSA